MQTRRCDQESQGHDNERPKKEAGVALIDEIPTRVLAQVLKAGVLAGSAGTSAVHWQGECDLLGKKERNCTTASIFSLTISACVSTHPTALLSALLVSLPAPHFSQLFGGREGGEEL